MAQVRLFPFMKPSRYVDISPGDTVRDILVKGGVDVANLAATVKVNNNAATLDQSVRPDDIINLVPRVDGGVVETFVVVG